MRCFARGYAVTRLEAKQRETARPRDRETSHGATANPTYGAAAAFFAFKCASRNVRIAEYAAI